MPPKGRKRKSNHAVASETQDAPDMTVQKIATKSAESPNKRRKIGVSIAQKQALIDNLQLEITERARKLRAQYNLQAQGLRTRIEIRINRIPMALRKVNMGDLMQKYADRQRQLPSKQTSTVMADPPPPVPEKDSQPAPPAARGAASPAATHAAPGRPRKRLSDEIDKENQTAHLDNPKKRQRGHPHTTAAVAAAAHGTQVPAQVLSPASSNARLNPRDRERVAPPSPAKSFVARPVSPEKQAAATTLLSTMVQKARSTRAAATRKATTSSTASSAAGRTTTATRTRKGAATTASTASTAVSTSRSAAAAAARAARRASGASEASDGSTATVVRKTGRATAATATSTARKTATRAASATKKSVMSSIKKGVTSAAAKKAAATKTTTASRTVSRTTTRTASRATSRTATRTASKATTTAATATGTTRSGRILRKQD